MHNHIVNGGAHPMARPNAEVYEPKLNGARPKAADYQSFIPVAFFQGEKPGWDFQMSSRVPLAGRATEPIATYTTGDVVPWKGGSRASLDPLTQLP